VPTNALPELPTAPDRATDDEATFLSWVGALAHRHRSTLAAVARREGLTPEDAVDAVQEAFHTLLGLPQARPLVGADDESRRFLIVLTRNVARNRRRAHAVARPHTADNDVLTELPHPAPTADELLAAAETHVRLASCVSELGDAQRAVVTLRLLDGASGDEVARALGITAGHVAVLLHRARAQLQSCMTRAPDSLVAAAPTTPCGQRPCGSRKREP